MRGEMRFVLTVLYVRRPPPPFKDRSVISADEVMHATCSILSQISVAAWWKLKLNIHFLRRNLTPPTQASAVR